MAEQVPVGELSKAVQQAVSAGKSCAFFITSADQHSAMITLEKGAISGLKYRNTRGYDAASAIAGLGTVRFQVAAEPTALPGEGDLNTRAVIEILSSGGSDATPPAAGVPAGVAGDLDALRDSYIGAIGPIGAALFEEAVEKLGSEVSTAEGYQQLVEELAANIDDENEAARFRQGA